MDRLSEIILCPMEEMHLDAVVALEEVSFPRPWKKEHFLQELSSPHSYPVVALEQGRVVGYLCLVSLFEEAQILDVAVAPSVRNRGVARLLIDCAESSAREKGAEYMALEVRASNHAARSLYEKLGYQQTGIRKLYYENSEDAVLMDKKLS